MKEPVERLSDLPQITHLISNTLDRKVIEYRMNLFSYFGNCFTDITNSWLPFFIKIEYDCISYLTEFSAFKSKDSKECS